MAKDWRHLSASCFDYSELGYVFTLTGARA
jgi:hypothetical protein